MRKIKGQSKLEIQEQAASYQIDAASSTTGNPLVGQSTSTELAQTATNQQWQNKRFFAEANIALPGLTSTNQSIDDLFEALLVQRGRLKEMLQLKEW